MVTYLLKVNTLTIKLHLYRFLISVYTIIIFLTFRRSNFQIITSLYAYEFCIYLS